MDIFELVRRFRELEAANGELEDRIKDLEDRVRELTFNKTDKPYPYIGPSIQWPTTKWTQPATYPHSFPNITCSTGEKV